MSIPKSKTRRAAQPRPSFKDRDDQVHMDLIGARAAVVTAIRAVEHKGSDLDDALALNLHRAALQPLERAIAAIRTHRS